MANSHFNVWITITVCCLRLTVNGFYLSAYGAYNYRVSLIFFVPAGSIELRTLVPPVLPETIC